MTLSYHRLSESEPPGTPDVCGSDPLERAWLFTDAIAASAAAICLETAGDAESDRETYRAAVGVHDSAVQLRTCLHALACGIDRDRVVAPSGPPSRPPSKQGRGWSAMAGEPHDDAAFANSVTYTVKVTVTVRGGTRRDTASRRTRRVAERVADAAARAKDVVEAAAVAGPSHDGEITWQEPVYFAVANTGRGALGDPAKLDRYLDPDHERALRSLSAARRRQQARRDADRRRRAAVGCCNTLNELNDQPRCRCVYCDPDDHYVARQLFANTDPSACGPPPCVCGQPTLAGARCLRHREVQIVALDDDPDALHALADTHLQQPNR